MWRPLLSLNARTIRCLASRAPSAKTIDKISKLRTEILRSDLEFFSVLCLRIFQIAFQIE
jgi:hypothetical protein